MLKEEYVAGALTALVFHCDGDPPTNTLFALPGLA
jgi:hypothetical protein